MKSTVLPVMDWFNADPLFCVYLCACECVSAPAAYFLACYWSFMHLFSFSLFSSLLL